MKKFLLFLLILLCGWVNAQQPGYIPMDTANSIVRNEQSKEYLEQSKLVLNTLTDGLKGKEARYYRNIYKDQRQSINEEILRGDYIFDDRFSAFTDSIVALISAATPDIPADLRFYLSRNISLNASSFGDKTFAINVGSFYYLDNEHQLAALIAHEIAHLLFNHHREVILSRYQQSRTDAKSSLKEIKRSKYGRGGKALERFKELLYADGKLNQRQEYEADSLGYELYRRAGFNPLEYISVYQLMEKYDTITPIGVTTGTYRQYFDIPDLGFREEWLKAEDFSRYEYSNYTNKFHPDSINSHPEHTARIEQLKQHFPELSAEADTTFKASGRFLTLSSIAGYERLHSLDYNEDYGIGLYLCLLGLQHNDPDSAYLMSYMGKFLTKISDARTKYTLNRYVDRVDPVNQSESYQQFLNFLWNMKLSELQSFAAYYSQES